ncbi:MAG: hypothetical protein K8J08_15970 [Thermoanaerobaculia bacterium]|nr:hypothetical protein [Thermoanaerobaculia bacterium]
MNRVEESRKEVERRLAELQRVVHRDVGRVPISARWTLPIAALSVGLLVARRVVRRRRRT